MKLTQLAKAVAAVQPNHSILLYGPPKTGKTRLVGTAAEIPEIHNIYWFDGENGAETLLHMGLSEQAMEKIHVIKIPDTRDNPIFIETVLRAFSAKAPILICDKHGKAGCVECAKSPELKDNVTSFSLGTCTHNDLVVIDSGSQLGDSALAATCLGKGDMYKPGWDEYGIQGKWLSDILMVIQQAKNTNFVVITHEIALENDEGKDQFFPLMGSKSFCMKVAKYFGTVAYIHKKLNKHVAGSSSTYRSDLVTGSRVNAMLEKTGAEGPNMRQILIEGGILKESAGTQTQVLTTAAQVAPVEAKPLSPLQAKLAAAKK